MASGGVCFDIEFLPLFSGLCGTFFEISHIVKCKMASFGVVPMLHSLNDMESLYGS
jgi:hypothetical protein